MSVDEATFKNALAQWSSGVTIVTTRLEDGTVKGMTASSFSSVSMKPFLILVCVARRLYTHRLLEQSGIFAVNILGTDHNYWGKLFAGIYPEVENRWEDIHYQTAVTGSPILPGALGWMDCRLYRQVEAGDHSIFLGEVVAAGNAGSGQPLMYYNRTWGTFSPLKLTQEKGSKR
jgi:flavin reductase (DIM6/NTAB) family NADH-FMN oxidoreductase RutF